MVLVFLSLAYFSVMISSSKQFFFQASWFHFSLLLNEILLWVFCIHSSADVRLGWLLHQLAAVNSKAIRMCARSTGEKILETQWRLSTLCFTAWNTKDFILRIVFLIWEYLHKHNEYARDVIQTQKTPFAEQIHLIDIARRKWWTVISVHLFVYYLLWELDFGIFHWGIIMVAKCFIFCSILDSGVWLKP